MLEAPQGIRYKSNNVGYVLQRCLCISQAEGCSAPSRRSLHANRGAFALSVPVPATFLCRTLRLNIEPGRSRRGWAAHNGDAATGALRGSLETGTMFSDLSKRSPKKRAVRFKAAAALTAVLASLLILLLYLTGRPGRTYPQERTAALTRNDLLVVMTATTER